MDDDTWDGFLQIVDESPTPADIIREAKQFFLSNGLPTPSSAEGLKDADIDGCVGTTLSLPVRAFAKRALHTINLVRGATRSRKYGEFADLLSEVRDVKEVMTRSMRAVVADVNELRNQAPAREHALSISASSSKAAVRPAKQGQNGMASGIGGGLTEGVHGNPLGRGKVVLLIGMRGAGKTCLGRKTADELKRVFVDLDDVLEKEIFQCSINDYVAANGWDAFREQETKVLKDALVAGKYEANSASGCVIACGGGIVESPSAVDLLKDYFPVIWINRHIEDICEYLESTGSYRPSLSKSPREVYAARWSLYEKCSDFVFTIRKGDHDWPAVDNDFVRFLRFAANVPNRDIQLAPDTFFLSFSFLSVEEAVATPGLLKKLCTNVDVLELRADLLKDPTNREWLLEELALLRRHAYTPIYFTLRTEAQGGRFGGDADQTLELLKLALKAGCEMIDVDVNRFSEEQIAELQALKRRSKFVGSHHEKCTMQMLDFEQALQMLMHKGEWDIFKIVQPASSVNDVLQFHACVMRMLPADAKMILILQGAEGRLSRILNRIMTPVTHPALPFPSGPGQMSVQELIPCRNMLSLFEPRRIFYIFGQPVALSASPTMQNVGFKVNGKPHVYERYDTPSVEDVAWKLSLVSTGGGSVTIPHKESLMHYMDSVSEPARAIGAINTVTKEPGTTHLRGDNTDWIGIKQQLLPKIKHRTGEKVGLIIGAGGTARAAAYAFRSMGLNKIFILNRTFEKADAIAKEFGDMFVAVKDVESMGEIDQLDAVMGTLPGQANFTLPQDLLEKHKPAVIEAAYRSSSTGTRFTSLLQQAVTAGCDTIEGIEMLFEQGCAQCEIWTGKSPPRKEIAQALLSDRFADDPSPPRNLVYEANL